MATKGWKVIQAHVPMIRFRKDGAARGTARAATPTQSTAPGTAPRAGTAGSAGPRVIALPVIEDFQLPLKFQRRPIDPKEIDYINRGGPE